MELPKVTVVELSPVRKQLEVEIAASDVQAELDRQFTSLGQRSRLRGFRPGKAPRAVLEKMFGDQVRREVVAHLVEETFYKAVESNQLDVVGTPEIEVGELSGGKSLTYKAAVDVRPQITLGDLSNLEASRPQTQVEETHVEQVLGSMRESAATLRPIEDRGVIEAGDLVTVDLATALDGGQPVRRADVLLEAGAGAFPLALERQIVGQHKGARLTLEVPYPADYGNAALAGKTASFEVEIRDLRAKELPALDDDFARDHGRSATMAELRDKIRQDLEHRAAHQADVAVRQSIIDQLIERHSFDVPGSLVERRTEMLLASLDARVPEGAEGQQLIERLRTELRPRAEREVRAELLLEAVAARESIEVGDADVTAEIDAIAAREHEAAERLRAFYDRAESRAALKSRMLRERALDRLVAGARIVPVNAEGEVARG